MIPSTIVEVPFASGVDQKSAPEWVAPGAQTSVLNGKWSKTGALSKRFGSTAASKIAVNLNGADTVTLANGTAVESHKGAHVVSDGSNLFGYSKAAGLLSYLDQVPECIATRQCIAQTTAGVAQSDVAATNGYACVAYRASDVGGTFRNFASIIDLSNNTQFGEPVQLDGNATKNGIRAIAVGTVFYVFWTNSSNNIVSSCFDTANVSAQWQPSAALATDVNAAAQSWAFSVAPVSGANAIVMAYQNNNVSNKVIKVALFSATVPLTAPPAASTTFSWGGTGLSPMVCSALRATNGETAWLAYCTTNGGTTTFVRAIGFNPATLATTVADTELWSFTAGNSGQVAGVARCSATKCVVAAGALGSSVSWQQFNTSAALVGPLRSQLNYEMWSLPAEVTMPGQTVSQIFSVFRKKDSASGSTYQLVDLNVKDTSVDNSVARPVATIAPREATTNLGSAIIAPNIVSAGNSQYLTSVWVDISTTRAGVYMATLDFGTQARHQSVELGDSLYMAGGVPGVFDGSQVAEHGFLHAPSLGAVTVSAGGLVDVGVHQYAVVYKWVNARGEMQRSQPVYSSQVTTTAGNQTVNLPIQPYNMTTKQDLDNRYSPAVLFDVYRNTLADPATFWQLAADTSEFASDPRSTTTTTIVDATADATLTSSANGTLYTGGNVLADQCPPSLTCLCTHKSRIFGVGDDGLTLWFTKQYVAGFTPGFNDELTLVVPEDGGTITGLASLDDHLVIFKRDRIFALYGTGPDVTGSNSDFSDFVRIPSPVGCTQSRSIVVTSAGVYFLSDQGLYLLTRGGEATYVGRAVEDTVAANPVCTAADIVAPLGEIRWCLAPSLTSATGLVVAYDYIQDKWGVHKYYDVDKAQSSTLVSGARAANGTWAWLSPGGQLNIESTTSHLDGGTQWVPLQVESAWVKAQGIGGWARFRRLFAEMEQSTAFQLTIDAAADYNTAYTQTQTWTDTQIAARSTTLPELDLQLANQKTQAVRFRLTDASPAVNPVGTGAGPVFLGMNLEVAAMPGGKGTRLPAGQRG